jgi:rubrerythrin
MSIKGTETEKNLLKAFAGESQARNRYSYFAKVAKEEGYVQIAAIFEETALQEQSHAKKFFRFLEGGDVEITVSYPAGKIGTTVENLKAAAMGEHEEWQQLYPTFAEIAEKEGFHKVAIAFRMIAKVEQEHEKRYNKLVSNIENGKVFKKDEKVRWQCTKCGYVHEGTIAPDKCPACDHPQSYFQEYAENY